MNYELKSAESSHLFVNYKCHRGEVQAVRSFKNIDNIKI